MDRPPVLRRLQTTTLLPLAVLLLATLAVPWLVFSPEGVARLSMLRRQRAEAEAELSRMSAEIEELRAAVERARNDPREVERVARDELGLVRKTEVVFQFRELPEGD